MGDIADLVLARRCLGCEEAPTLLCFACRDGMRNKASVLRELRFDDVTADLRIPLATAHAYAAPLSTVIYKYKDNQIPELASFLAHLLAEAIELITIRTPYAKSDIVLVPIPSRGGSLRVRGFDPMARISTALHKHGFQHVQALVDFRNSGRSKSLNIAQRKAATHNAFGMRNDSVVKTLEGRQVIVIDDVTTTGATLREAAEVLMHAGVHVIGCASVAGVRRRS